MSLRDEVLKGYIEAQRGLVEIEQVDETNVVLSLPLHFSANTRVEITVTKITENYFAISDMAQTIGELKDAGLAVGPKLMEKLSGLVKAAGMEFAGNHLVKKCSFAELGESIQVFADAAKTIGDAYLTYKIRRPKEEEDELVTRVRNVFAQRKIIFNEKQEIHGEIENHIVDFYVAPNGTKGLALAVLPNPSQLVAEAWGFKTQDIKHVNSNLAVSVVYDSSKAKEVSKAILDKMADVPVPSNVIGDLGSILERAGITTQKKK